MGPIFYRKIISQLGGESAVVLSLCQLAVQLPPVASVAKCAVQASASLFVLLPALNTPLPFLQQLLIQAVQLVGLVTLQLAPGLHFLDRIPHTNEAQQLCIAMNSVTQVTEALVIGTAFPVQHYDQQCMAHAERMLLLFADVYLAFVMPVYLSVRLERYSKRLYLHLELGGEEAPLPFMLLFDALMAALLGLAAWVLVLYSHEPLAAWARPL
jgi:hypothetical protein